MPWLHAVVLLALREKVLRKVPKWQELCLGIKCKAVLHMLRRTALFYRDSDLFQVEAMQNYGPNVISWQLVTGRSVTPCGDCGTTVLEVRRG